MKALGLVASFAICLGVAAADTPQERMSDAASVLNEIMATPDKGIPRDLLQRAQCVIIIPGMKKAAFVVGGEYGKGFAVCRAPEGVGWNAPAAVKLEGGSVGFQIGGSSTDIVMLVMNDRGMQRLLGDKFTLGGDASIAAGPVGRTANANTDLRMTAEILAWSRAKGLFAGISLNGATLHQDQDENRALYGHKMSNREVLTGSMQMPAGAQQLVSELDQYSGHRRESDADRSK